MTRASCWSCASSKSSSAFRPLRSALSTAVTTNTTSSTKTPAAANAIRLSRRLDISASCVMEGRLAGGPDRYDRVLLGEWDPDEESGASAGRVVDRDRSRQVHHELASQRQSDTHPSR